jgi:hypothetical protein
LNYFPIPAKFGSFLTIGMQKEALFGIATG